MDWERVGEAIRRDRVRMYGTRASFGSAAGLSISVLSDLERGTRSNFDGDTLGKVEDALGWAPGTIDIIGAGGRIRRSDTDLARLRQAWPRLTPDVRALIADLAERSASRHR